jgi:hypothetical protein
MTFIRWELQKALEEQYKKEHPNWKNEKSLTKEEFMDMMRKKGFHFAGD